MPSHWFKVPLAENVLLFLIKNHILYIVTRSDQLVEYSIVDVKKHALNLCRIKNKPPKHLKRWFTIEFESEVYDLGVEFSCYNHVTDWYSVFDGTQYDASIDYKKAKNVTAKSEQVQSLPNGVYKIMACQYVSKSHITCIWVLDRNGVMYCNLPVQEYKHLESLFRNNKQSNGDVSFIF